MVPRDGKRIVDTLVDHRGEQRPADGVGRGTRHIRERVLVGDDDLVQAVGGLPEASAHASHLAMDALAAVLDQVKI